MAVNIVPLSETTINGFHKALGAVARERKYLALTDAPSLVVIAHFADRLQKQGCPQLVALDGRHVVGWCDLRPLDDELQAHVAVLGMGVLAAHRGQGIGRALLEAILARSIFERIELSVFADNTVAISLYEKAGFVHEGVKRRAVNLDGHKDLVLMARIKGEP